MSKTINPGVLYPPVITANNTKNRKREAPTFANINLLGKCNFDCFFLSRKRYK